MRMWVHYEAPLPTLSLWDEGKSRTILSGEVITIVEGHIFFKK